MDTHLTQDVALAPNSDHKIPDHKLLFKGWVALASIFIGSDTCLRNIFLGQGPAQMRILFGNSLWGGWAVSFGARGQSPQLRGSKIAKRGSENLASSRELLKHWLASLPRPPLRERRSSLKVALAHASAGTRNYLAGGGLARSGNS